MRHLLQKLSPEEHQKALFGHLYAGLDEPLYRPVVFGPFPEIKPFKAESENIIQHLEAVKKFPFHLFPASDFKQPLLKRA